ncbi:MAG: 5'-methylthioadenosine phosphorylase [Betaproteobacteria bacterium RIFCSPLOWO2_02_FULL_67_26]|nr:MAG: 5'-methylthioadenosine phosphorylase [Betaproteobacteria bacterium RIFCSPLOWO2_02_FULL_67_26]
MLGIIGGSGLDRLDGLEAPRKKAVRTPYGRPSGALAFGRMQGREVVFLARHGPRHAIAPHEVNYRANIWALHAQRVKDVVSVASVGGIHPDLVPGTLVVPDQIIDYTHGRRATFGRLTDGAVMHVDFTRPYCESLRQRLLRAAAVAGERIAVEGTYAATQGPRLETAAEIDRLERDGADMVGMTGMPEAALARELGLCYAAIAVVVNHAAGRGTSIEEVRLADFSEVMQRAMTRVRSVLNRLVGLDGD